MLLSPHVDKSPILKRLDGTYWHGHQTLLQSLNHMSSILYDTMKNIINFCLFFATGLASPFELISKRPLVRADVDSSPLKRTACPAYLPVGEYEFPHYITQISASQPDKSFGPQYNGLFTPNDISSIFSFDIPASRADWNCTLEFLFPSQSQLKTSSYTYSGAGTFVFTGYLAGSCPGSQTTYNNQPTPGKYPAFPPVHMEPGYAYTLDIGPCYISAGTCVAGCKLFCFLLAVVDLRLSRRRI